VEPSDTNAAETTPEGAGVGDPQQLVFLAESSDPVEFAGWRSLLEGAGIGHAMQGMHHASLLAGPLGNPAIVPRLLVTQADLSRAQALLAAEPVAEERPSTLEAGVCPQHQAPAVGACDRCGTFVCRACAAETSPLVCERCVHLEERDMEERRERARQRKRRFVIGLLVFVALGFAASLLIR
jgi:hypothetical protein